MQKILPLLLLFIGFSLGSHAQYSRYIIKFKDKGGNPFSISNPSQYLTQRSLDRRARYNISIDSTDLPVTPRYVDSLRLAGAVTILNTSKWLNQAAIQTSDAAALTKINGFPFVLSVSPIAARSMQHPANKQLDVPGSYLETIPAGRPQDVDGFYEYGSSDGQVRIHNGDFLHNHGFRGEGMQLAMLDAGFINYLSLPTFDSIRNNNQVLGTWDFVENETSVNEDNSHGTQCLSTIAANLPGVFVGTAPKTSFYLYRTEDVFSEYPIEEQNWAAGVERADSLGVDIASTSLGYYNFDGSDFDYTYNDLNGNITISARAADIAAQKGMLIVVAAGNEGNNPWHFLISPSDADSVLSVGAVNISGQVAGFSSYGPSSDGQIKPSVAAVGSGAVVANTSTGMPAFGSGTSFACPNMAGIATCLWQAFPEVNNMAIIQALELSSSEVNNPDDRVGYGIPDAKKAFVTILKQLRSMEPAVIADCKAQIQFGVKTDPTMTIEIERKLAGELTYSTITTLQDNGNFAKHDFVYADELSTLSLGEIKYRLKMIISTDTTFYLDSVTVNHSQACVSSTQNTVTINPNPVSDNLNITIVRSNPSRIDIVIQNAAGQKVYVNQSDQIPGTQVRTVSMKNMSKGIYFVSVYIDNKKEITKKILRH